MLKQHPHHNERNNQIEGIIPGKHQIMIYLSRCWSVVTDALVLLTVTIVAYITILYICKILWNLYMSTHMGEMFITLLPDEAKSTSQLMQMDFATLSIWITIYSFIISIAVGSIYRLIYLNGYLYEPFGFLGRTIACGLPLTALVAFHVKPLYNFQTWDTTFLLVLLPTLSVYSRCFDYAKKLLPEVGDMKIIIDLMKRK